jgi:hypothetical protein
MKWFEHLKVHLFPPVTRDMALIIATQALAQPVAAGTLVCHSKKPDQFHIYANLTEPCWWVQVLWGDGNSGLMIRSSRVIVIGRQSGKVYYDGSAGDEG